MNDAKSLQDQLIEELSEICDKLGLVIGILTSPNDGVLIGTQEFVTEIVMACNGSIAEMLEADESGELIDMQMIKPDRSDDPTFH